MDVPEGFDSLDRGSTPDHPPLTALMVRAMIGIGPWARFFSILGIIFLVLGAMGAMIMLVLGIAGFSIPAEDTRGPGSEFLEMFGFGTLGLLYLVMTLIYVYPVVFLFKIANGVARMKSGDMVVGMENALTNQRSLYKYLGILTIIMLCLYPVVIILLMIVALSGITPSH
jgi:hypothetical protein